MKSPMRVQAVDAVSWCVLNILMMPDVVLLAALAGDVKSVPKDTDSVSLSSLSSLVQLDALDKAFIPHEASERAAKIKDASYRTRNKRYIGDMAIGPR